MPPGWLVTADNVAAGSDVDKADSLLGTVIDVYEVGLGLGGQGQGLG
jgi:hypothetical protein